MQQRQLHERPRLRGDGDHVSCAIYQLLHCSPYHTVPILCPKGAALVIQYVPLHVHVIDADPLPLQEQVLSTAMAVGDQARHQHTFMMGGFQNP